MVAAGVVVGAQIADSAVTQLQQELVDLRKLACVIGHRRCQVGLTLLAVVHWLLLGLRTWHGHAVLLVVLLLWLVLLVLQGLMLLVVLAESVVGTVAVQQEVECRIVKDHAKGGVQSVSHASVVTSVALLLGIREDVGDASEQVVVPALEASGCLV